jgi:hypothetical protein
MFAAVRGERGGIAIGELTAYRPAARQSEGSLDEFIDKRWAGLLALALAIGATAYLFYVFTRFPLPPGTDTGQWLTISRYYSFESVPSDRSVMTVPPVVPVLLAALSLFSGTTGAPVMLAAALYAGFCAIAFVLGKRLCGDAVGGLFALVTVCVLQSQLFEFFAMGAYPQLAALLGMSLCLYALFALTRDATERRAWLTLAGGVALTLFSHTPSATVLVPALGLSLAYVAWSADDRRGVTRTALTTLGPVAVLWLAFLFINRDVIFGYANVPAAYDLKGPDKLFDNIWRNNVQRIVFGGGLVMIVALPFMKSKPVSLRRNPAVVLAVWTSALIAVVASAALQKTGTDYPRFAAYFIVPLGLAAAAGVQSFGPSRGAAIAILVPALLFAGHDGMRHFNTAARFYGMNERSDDLAGVASWLNTSAEDGGVIGGTRETKWLQALTGRDSLLYLPRIYIVRPWEVERAIAAEVVHRSNGGIETGRMLVTANDGGQDFGNVFPTGVRVDAFHKGLYTHAFTMRDSTQSLVFESVGVTQRVSLASFENGGTTAYHDATGEHLLTRFDAPSSPVQMFRLVSASNADLNTLTVDYYIGLPDGVRPEALVVGTGDSGNIEVKPGATWYVYPVFGDGSWIEVEATTSWLADPTPPAGANPFLRWRKATVTFDLGEGDRRIPRTQLYDPMDVLGDAGVRYLIDRNGDGAAFPIIRSRGLTPVFENEEYEVYDVSHP